MKKSKATAKRRKESTRPNAELPQIEELTGRRLAEQGEEKTKHKK